MALPAARPTAAGLSAEKSSGVPDRYPRMRQLGSRVCGRSPVEQLFVQECTRGQYQADRIDQCDHSDDARLHDVAGQVKGDCYCDHDRNQGCDHPYRAAHIIFLFRHMLPLPRGLPAVFLIRDLPFLCGNRSVRYRKIRQRSRGFSRFFRLRSEVFCWRAGLGWAPVCEPNPKEPAFAVFIRCYERCLLLNGKGSILLNHLSFPGFGVPAPCFVSSS